MFKALVHCWQSIKESEHIGKQNIKLLFKLIWVLTGKRAYDQVWSSDQQVSWSINAVLSLPSQGLHHIKAGLLMKHAIGFADTSKEKFDMKYLHTSIPSSTWRLLSVWAAVNLNRLHENGFVLHCHQTQQFIVPQTLWSILCSLE